MKYLEKLAALTVFGQFQMEEASDLEVRLTFYLLIYLLNSPKHWNFIYLDDLLYGREFFDDNGKRTLITKGAGIPKHQMNKAIDLVNKRRLILINKKDDNHMIAKLNLKYIENVSKQNIENFQN